MITAISVLLAVAAELADLAKASMPELSGGERIVREWISDGIFYRETALGVETHLYQFDFRQRKSRREAVGK